MTAVRRLVLSDFRNYPALDLAVDAPMVALVGENGVGKTNILEALSLLAPGRGLRSAALPDMAARHAVDGFAVSAECRVDGAADQTPVAPLILGTGTRGATLGRRRARINGADHALNALAEWIALVWLTPAMDRLFMDGASARRRFVDRLTLALLPGHARAASRYEAATRARSKLLADSTAPDIRWLAALEAQMGEHGAELDRARHAMVAALTTQVSTAPTDGFPLPDLQLADDGARRDQAWSAEHLTRALHDNRRQDARAGRALLGPHRQDLLVHHAASAMPASLCSTGEQKALLLSLVLAHGDVVAARRGQRPLLLLDEIAAHLDPDRRRLLFARLLGSDGQCWLTGTEPDLFTAMDHSALRLTVVAGTVASAAR